MMRMDGGEGSDFGDSYDTSTDDVSAYEKLLSKLGMDRRPILDSASKKRLKKIKLEKKGDKEEAQFAKSPANVAERGVAMKSSCKHALCSSLRKCRFSDSSDMSGDCVSLRSEEVPHKECENRVQVELDYSENKSYFDDHLRYELPESEAEEIQKHKCSFEWAVPDFGNASANWVGTGRCFMKGDRLNTDDGLKSRLQKYMLDVYQASGRGDFSSSRQRWYISLFSGYRDVLHSRKRPFYLNRLEDSDIMDAYTIHALNHILSTKELVIKNNARVENFTKKNELQEAIGQGLTDQGFTRPKVLILLPLKSVALRFIRRLIELTPPSNKVSVEYKERFFREFVSETAEDSDLADLKSQASTKPADHQALFGGNSDDHFRIGLQFTRKSIKLYNDFYSSDMIIASPLGLVTKIEESETEKDKDVDFLSSIEILIIDHADVIAMQNWGHVMTILKFVNHMPTKQHDTDIMRIRNWYLDGKSKFYRQTILLTYFTNPDINSTFNRTCVNYQGKVKYVSKYKGVLANVLVQVNQVYERFDSLSLSDVDEARFNYFIQKVFSKIKESLQGGVMIFTSSYFEFIRVRNFLKSQKASFCMLSEYMSEPDKSRARTSFFHGKYNIILYTERAHFYFRYKVRGVKSLIFYSLPERMDFYPEIANLLGEADDPSCRVLFSQFDNYKLERIVGTTASKKMLSPDKSAFVFC